MTRCQRHCGRTFNTGWISFNGQILQRDNVLFGLLAGMTYYFSSTLFVGFMNQETIGWWERQAM
jgi:hypothetical protein